MKFTPIALTLRKDGTSRSTVLANAHKTLDELPDDMDITISIKKVKESRRLLQNRHYQSAIGQVVEQTGNDPEVVAGMLKFRYLISLKEIHAADNNDEKLKYVAAFERDLSLLCMERYDGDDMYRAFDRAIRSKTCSVPLFAKYVDAFLRFWAEKGVNFVLSREEKEVAMHGWGKE